MKKTERLFHVIEQLRAARQPITAQTIADELGVSVRTIYRDITLLTAQGLPISGEAGLGYVIASDFNAPALQFSIDELDIIAIGLRMAYRDGDEPMRRAADLALSKIRSGLKRKDQFDTIDLYAPGRNNAPNADFMTRARLAIRNKVAVEMNYISLGNTRTTRRVKPMALLFFKESTLLSGWCETRQDFRNFRLDRITTLRETSESFKAEHYKLRKAYFDMINEESRIYKDNGHTNLH